MNWILELGRQPAASRLGEVLLHFLWQGSAVAALLAWTLVAMRHATPNSRYRAACVALLTLTVLPLATWCWLAVPDRIMATNHAAVMSGGTTTSPSLLPASRSRVPDWMQPGLPWLTLAWLIGVSLCGARLLGGCWQAQRMTRNVTQPVEAPWPETLRELACRFGIRRPVALLESIHVATPMVLGWLKPVILLPAGLVVGLSPGQVSALLAHELAHVRRHDYLVNLLQCVVESMLFYHPAVWWISHRIRIERELCCDDLAVTVLDDRRVLADALVTLAERECAGVTLALGADGGSLTQRVRRLLQEPPLSPAPSRFGYLLTLLLAFALGAGGLWLGQHGFDRGQAAPSLVPDPPGLKLLENQIAQLDDRIEKKQEQVDQLRVELRVPDVVAESGGPLLSILTEESRQMLATRTELENRITQQQELIKYLKGRSSDEQRYHLNLIRPTPLLGTLLSDLIIAEEHKERLAADFGPQHPDVERAHGQLARINTTIDDVVHGIMDSMEIQINVDETTLNQVQKSLEATRIEEAKATVTYRPYLREKKELDTLMRAREAVSMLLLNQGNLNAAISAQGL